MEEIKNNFMKGSQEKRLPKSIW